MRTLSTDKLKQWFNDMKAQCEQLKGKTDNISNAIRMVNCEQMSQIMSELIRRNEYAK